MFSKQSRYRRVPDIAVPDARGRVLAAKDIRPLPDVTGTFRHTVNSGDRLDQLAYSYYGEPCSTGTSATPTRSSCRRWRCWAPNR